MAKLTRQKWQDKKRSSDSGSRDVQSGTASKTDITRRDATTEQVELPHINRDQQAIHTDQTHPATEIAGATQGGDQPAATPDQSNMDRSMRGFFYRTFKKPPAALQERLNALDTSDTQNNPLATPNFPSDGSLTPTETYIRAKALEMLRDGKSYTDKQLQQGRTFLELKDTDFPSRSERARIEAVDAAQQQYIKEAIDGSYHMDKSEAATIAKSVLRHSVDQEMKRITEQRQQEIAYLKQELSTAIKATETLRVSQLEQSKNVKHPANSLQQKIKQYQYKLQEINDHYKQVTTLPNQIQDTMYAFLDKEWCQTYTEQATTKIERETLLRDTDKNRLDYIQNKLNITSIKLRLKHLEAQKDNDNLGVRGDDYHDELVTKEHMKLKNEAHRLEKKIQQREQSIRLEQSNYQRVQNDLPAATSKLDRLIENAALPEVRFLRDGANPAKLGSETGTVSNEKRRIYDDLTSKYEMLSYKRSQSRRNYPDNPDNYADIDHDTEYLRQMEENDLSRAQEMSEEANTNPYPMDQQQDPDFRQLNPQEFKLQLEQQKNSVVYINYDNRTRQEIEELQKRWIYNGEKLTNRDKHYLKDWFTHFLQVNREESILQELPNHKNPEFTHLTEYIRTSTIAAWETQSTDPGPDRREYKVPDTWPLDEDMLSNYLRSYFRIRQQLSKADPPSSL